MRIKFPFRVTECTFSVTEWLFNDTERTFSDTERRFNGVAETFAREINKRCKCIYSEFCCNFVED